jgi:hypothetical protein
VFKKFSKRFVTAMTLLTMMLKEEAEAKAKILRLPSPNPLLLLEGPKDNQMEVFKDTLSKSREIVSKTELTEALKQADKKMEQ